MITSVDDFVVASELEGLLPRPRPHRHPCCHLAQPFSYPSPSVIVKAGLLGMVLLHIPPLPLLRRHHYLPAFSLAV